MRLTIRIILVAAAFGSSCVTRPATPTPPLPDPRPDLSRPGPWDNDLLVIRLDADGRQESLTVFPRGGVPTAVRMKDGRLIAAYQHFPQDDAQAFDRVAVRFSADEGRTWTPPEPIVVYGMEAGLARPFDPALVPLPDGRVRLYFTSNRDRNFRRSAPAIHSAVSSDGVRFGFEPGVRFAVEGRVVIDCAVALHEGVFHLVAPDNGTPDDLAAAGARRIPPPGGTGYHAVSRDGLRFARVADVVGNDSPQACFTPRTAHPLPRDQLPSPAGPCWPSTRITFTTIMAIALREPTITTSRLPRVTAV